MNEIDKKNLTDQTKYRLNEITSTQILIRGNHAFKN